MATPTKPKGNQKYLGAIMSIDVKISIADEQALLDSYEQDEWRSVGSLQSEIQRYQAYATAMLEGNGLIHISLTKTILKILGRKRLKRACRIQHTIINE